MPSFSTKNDADVNSEDRIGDSSDASLWLTILEEVEKAHKLQSSENLLLLEDNCSREASLMTRLKCNNLPFMYEGDSGLEYFSTDVEEYQKPKQMEPEIIAEGDEAFLCRLERLLNQQTCLTGWPLECHHTPSPGVEKSADRRLSGSPGVGASPKVDGKLASSVAGEGVLQNFFNSLLNRKPGSPIASNLTPLHPPGDNTAVPQDGVAELQQLGESNSQDPVVALEHCEHDLINQT